MAFSSLNRGQIQQIAADFGRFMVSPGELFPRLSNYEYIDALIEEEVKKMIVKTIRSTFESLSTQGIRSSVVTQFWAATKASEKVYLLTTTCQANGFLGDNEELRAFLKDCLHHKIYVYNDTKEKKGATLGGFPGLAFLKGAIQHNDNVHDYPKDQRPPCEDAIFERKWRSCAVPVIDFTDKFFGVFEFIYDTPNDSFDAAILAACGGALQNAGLQFSFPCNPPNELEMICGQERTRTTDTSDVTGYRFLVPLMGLAKEVAAEKLGQVSGAKKTIKQSTFRNLRKNVGMPEWPYISKKARGDGFPELSSEQPTTDMEYQNNNAPFMGINPGFMDDIEELINNDYPDTDWISNAMDEDFHMRSWGQIYDGFEPMDGSDIILDEIDFIFD